KPAELVPGCAWALADILANAGLPAGVFNLIMGRGSIVGEVLVTHPDVAALSFTGSVETGRSIAAKAVARMAKLQLEMGGKNPMVVLDDADLATAVNCAVQGAYYSTGQRCTASSRLIVTAGIHDRFVAAMKEKLASLKVDDALAGMVMVNVPTAGVDYHVPFGGRKGSSYGPREQGRYAAEFFTSVKTAYIAP